MEQIRNFLGQVQDIYKRTGFLGVLLWLFTVIILGLLNDRIFGWGNMKIDELLLSFSGVEVTLSNIALTVNIFAAIVVLLSLYFGVRDIKKRKIHTSNEKVDKKEYKIYLHPIEDDFSSEELSVWIEIVNDEDVELTDCYADLKTVLIKNGDKWIVYTDRVNKTLSKLSWPDFANGADVTIRRKSNARLDLARTNNGKRAIMFLFENGEQSITDNLVYIKIGVNGMMYEKPIEEKIITGFLRLENMVIPGQENEHKTTRGSYKIKNGEVVKSHRETKMEKVISRPYSYSRLYLEEGKL